MPTLSDPISARDLRATFDQVAPSTVGVEEEVMLLDPSTYELAPIAPRVLERLDGDARFKLEMPASQIEITLGPFPDLHGLGSALHEARGRLAQAAGGMARPACAGVHPFSPGVGALNRGGRYDEMTAEYGPVALRQLVCALQVHVAVGGAERTLAVHNALRSHLPQLAALAANAPFYEGRDCGLASVRPKLAELLPRQGVPPSFGAWEDYARALAWGARSGTFAKPAAWWWELRLHPTFGTLELRVPDAQTTVADAVAVALVAHALVLWLSARFDAGEALPVHETWRIEENRWSAARYGVHGRLADLDTGQSRATSDVLLELLDHVAPIAATLAGADVLAHARGLATAGGAQAQRRVAAAGGESVRGVAAWLAERFLA
jgi:carboxylate-amine ligase